MEQYYSIILDDYAKNARDQFNDYIKKYSALESEFKKKPRKTFWSLIFSLIGTLFWIAAFIAGAVYAKNFANSTLLLITMISVGTLLLCLLLDFKINWTYSREIDRYEILINMMRRLCEIANDSIEETNIKLMNFRDKGWDFPYKAWESSYLKHVEKLESEMSRIESRTNKFLKFIKFLKAFFFFASVATITATGCLALFPFVNVNLTEFYGNPIGSDVLLLINVIASFVTLIGEIFLAKLIWAKSKFDITNTTLLFLPTGPIAFLALIVITIILILLVMAIFVWIILPIAVLGIITFFLVASANRRN